MRDQSDERRLLEELRETVRRVIRPNPQPPPPPPPQGQGQRQPGETRR